MKKILLLVSLCASVLVAQAQVSYNVATILTTNALVGSVALAGPTTPVNVTLYDTVGLQISGVVSNGGAAVWCGAGTEYLYAHFGVSTDGSQLLDNHSGGAMGTNVAKPVIHTLAMKYNTNQIGNGVVQAALTNINVKSEGYLHLLYITNAGSVATLCMTNVQVKVIKKPFIRGGREGGG